MSTKHFKGCVGHLGHHIEKVETWIIIVLLYLKSNTIMEKKICLTACIYYFDLTVFWFLAN